MQAAGIARILSGGELPRMRLTIFAMLLTLGACFTVALCFFAAMLVAIEVRRTFGREWELLAFGSVILLGTGAGFGIFRWQDELMGMLGIAGHVRPDALYCQTCGTAASPNAMTCAACGGLRFALSIPGTASKTRWHVQVGMDVLGSDERPIGVVKRRRVLDFLVARPLKRDVYVPFSAISSGNGREIQLSVPTDFVGTSGWARSALMNRPR